MQILSEREVWYSSWLPYILILTICIIAVVRIINPSAISSILRSLFTRPASNTNFRETIAIQERTSWLLVVNFIISGATFCFMHIHLSAMGFQPINAIYLPLIIMIHPYMMLTLSGVISGEYKRIKENLSLHSMSLQVLGILLIPMNIMILLNPQVIVQTNMLLIVAIIVIYLTRILRGSSYAIQNKINWYYIILYICGLEILPFLLFIEYSGLLS